MRYKKKERKNKLIFFLEKHFLLIFFSFMSWAKQKCFCSHHQHKNGQYSVSV